MKPISYLFKTKLHASAGLLLPMLSLCGSVTLDENGWTVITPSEDSRIVYVSSSEGDDSNDGLSPNSPKRTIAAGNILIRDGFPDHLLLKRSDVFSPSGPVLERWKSGRSAEEPIVCAYYGESGPRPLVKLTDPFVNHNGRVRNYQAFIGLDLYRAISDPDSPDYADVGSYFILRFVGGGDNIIVEDCRLRFGESAIQSYEDGVYRHFRFARNIVTDAWTKDSSVDGSRTSGIFVSGVEGSYIFEENFFDHNGWNKAVESAGANKFNHNLYIQRDNVAGGIIRGNILARGSSHGLQGRSGGVIERNLYVLNAVSMNVGGNKEPTDPDVLTFDNRATQNVILNGRHMIPGAAYTSAVWGIDARIDLIPDSTVEDNIVANAIGDGTNFAYQGESGATMIDNIAYNWGDNNDDMTDASWPHPDDDLGDYFATVDGGTDSTEAYLDWLEERPIRTMPWKMTAYAAINYIREGFNKSPVEGYYQYNTEDEIAVTGVSLQPTELTLSLGDTTTVEASVMPSNASNQSVVWTSSAPSVATVNDAGIVTATSEGTASITVTTDDNHFTAIATVTVESEEPDDWYGYEIQEGAVYTGNHFLGWIQVEQTPWVYSYLLNDWIFVSVGDLNSQGGLWGYFNSFGTIEDSSMAPWVVNATLDAWMYIPDYASGMTHSWAFVFNTSD